MSRRLGVAALSIAAVAVVLGACGKIDVGGKCTAGQSACVDARSGLFCGSDNTYKSMTCSGPGGCKADGAKVVCDHDVAAVADGCNTPNDVACAADQKSLLQCKNEAFALIDACKGPGGCKINPGAVVCDSDIADVGDTCSNIGSYACMTDKSAALRCDSGKYALAQSCRGPKACAIAHPKPQVNDIDCDFTIAAENDPCAFADNQACSANKQTMFTCAAGSKYGKPTACPGPNGCSATMSGKVARAICDGASGAAAAPSGGPWAGKYRCGVTETVELTQLGKQVVGVDHTGLYADAITCTTPDGNAAAAAANCAGTYTERVRGGAPTSPRKVKVVRNPKTSAITFMYTGLAHAHTSVCKRQ